MALAWRLQCSQCLPGNDSMRARLILFVCLVSCSMCRAFSLIMYSVVALSDSDLILLGCS